MTNQALAQPITESTIQLEGAPIRISPRPEPPLMNTVQEYADNHPKVEKWLNENFHDNGTRSAYGWYLKAVCKDLKIEPEKLLKLADNKPSILFSNIKQHLTSLANGKKSRRAYQMKAAIVSFVNYYNENPNPFNLNVKIKIKAKYDRPYWVLDDWKAIEKDLNSRYRPLVTIGVMCGFGRRELAYLNSHLNQVKPVPGVPEACYLSMPARKSNTDFYKAIMPTDEFEALGGQPLLTTTKQLVGEYNLTQQFKAALRKSKKKQTGTGVHVLRAIFRSVGGNVGIDEKILEQQMGHIESYHYDRTDQDLPKRAKAMLPLWEYFRQGPAVASSQEVDKLAKENKQLQIRVKELEESGNVKVLEAQIEQLRLAVTMLQDAGKYKIGGLDAKKQRDKAKS